MFLMPLVLQVGDSNVGEGRRNLIANSCERIKMCEETAHRVETNL